MHGLIYFVFLIITFVFITLYIIVNTKLLKLFLFGSDIFVVIISFVSFITYK